MYEVFEKLLAAYNMTIYRFCKETGVSESTIYTWKKKKTQCSAKLQKIVCEYFNISVDYLMTEKEKDDIPKYYLNDETAQVAQEITKVIHRSRPRNNPRAVFYGQKGKYMLRVTL